MKSFLSTLLFCCFIAMVNAQAPQGFFLDNWQLKTVLTPLYENTAQTTTAKTVTVTVDLSNQITPVSSYLFGNNGVPWAGKMNTDAALMNHIKNLSPNILRWPGGNLSNEYFWDAVEGKGPTDIPPTLKIDVLNAGRHTASWAMTTNEYYDMLKKTNSTGSICVNYSYARYGTSADPVATAAHYAANWVRYDNGRTKIWEIGNENMGSWEAGYKIDTQYNKDHQPEIISGELYGKHCRVFIDSMRQAASEVGSEIKIGVVAVESYVSWDNVMKNWNAGMMPLIADKADFLIVHSYYTPYNENSTIATILNSASSTKDFKNYALKDLKTYAKNDTMPVALTEWNIFAVGSKQSVSYINGMHCSLVLGELIKNKYGEATRWDLMNGWSNGDDHGLFSSSDEPGVTLRTPHAPFFYLYYFQKYFGDYMVNSTVSGSSNIVAYASSYNSGQSSVVVINKGTTQQVVELNLSDTSKVNSYYRYVLTGGTDNGNFSRQVFVNGSGPSGSGGGPANYASLKALGTRVDGSIQFVAPPLSVTYLLATSDTIPPLTGVKSLEKSSFKVFPNPARDHISINSSNFSYQRIEITDLAGKKVFEQMFNEPVSQTTDLQINLDRGIYIVNLFQSNYRQSARLVIE